MTKAFHSHLFCAKCATAPVLITSPERITPVERKIPREEWGNCFSEQSLKNPLPILTALLCGSMKHLFLLTSNFIERFFSCSKHQKEILIK